jgi:Phosphotransferase enzyme family
MATITRAEKDVDTSVETAAECCDFESSSDVSAQSAKFSTRVASVLTTINHHLLVSLAINVRQKLSHAIHGEGNEDEIFQCEVIEPPICGAFNLLYELQFNDGLRWVIRIPLPGLNNYNAPSYLRSLRSTVTTMSFLRQNTSMPIPEIHDFDDTTENSVGMPYILMEWVQGVPVYKKWFNSTGSTPLSDLRLRILDSVAEVMSQLSQFQFDKIGSLTFDSDNLVPATIGEFDVPDEAADFENLESGTESVLRFNTIGPFDSSRDYFKALLNTQKKPEDNFSVGIHHLLLMMIQCIPPSVSSVASKETFVLAHPDFDSQNVLVSEDGTIASLIDWDNVHTVPRIVGYTRYPAWITRDWDPIKYGYDDEGDQSENSPEELEYYRNQYASLMKQLLKPDLDFSTKSHLYEAVWIAASSSLSIDHIVEKIFLHVFPEDLEDSLGLYETAVALAENQLNKHDELRIMKEFQDLFK